MKQFSVLAAIVLLTLLPASLRAVTPEELEQARTIAAIVYLRNANNGSDYLDKVTASTRTELKGKLHNDKDRKNLELFNNRLPSASGSDKWGKEELVKHAQAAVKAPGNYESTGYASNTVAKRVRAMTIKPRSEKPEEPKPEAEPQQQPEQQAAPTPDTVPTAVMPDPFATTDEPLATDSAMAAAEDSLLNAGADKVEPQSAGNSSTIYIIILVILVVLVVVLVIYAARYFARQGKSEKRRDDDDDADDESANSGTDRDIIRSQERTIDSLRAENAELRRVIEEYKYQINYLKSDSHAAAPAAAATLNDTFAERHTTAPAPATRTTTRVSGAPERTTNANGTQRVIYLGRSNREGMFIRAERNLNPQHSLFRLTTSDNLTGTFSVADDPEVEQRILSNPDVMLAVSCDVDDPDTFGKESVVTETPGTAIFENGRWRVLRPALVRFV